MSRFYTHFYRQLKLRSQAAYQKTTYFIKKKPLTSFFLVLLILLGLIVISNFLAVQKTQPPKPEIVKSVQIYQVNKNPKVTLQAKIEKSGVIKISALTPGVIQSINVHEGDRIQKGKVLVNMSSNYQGGNAVSVQRQLAAKQYQHNKDTLDTQKDIIKTQKEIAEKSESNTAQLRDITSQSLQETKDLINLNQEVIDTLTQNQATLEKNNIGGINDTAILQLKSQRAQVQAGLNQLRSGLRQAEFQSAGDKPPAELTRLQRDLTLKQLDLQQKALELGIEVSRLQLVMAQINEALYFPASPFAAMVQRIYIKEGQAVNPGMPLFILSAIDDPITAIVNLPQNLAGAVSSIEPSTLYINDQTLNLTPYFISKEATDGTLYSVFYTIPDSFSPNLTEGGTISIDIPIGVSQAQTTSSIPFIPLDAVYQSANVSSVLVVSNNKAISKTITLGNVFGKFVEVKSGLGELDQVILNRNILAGDKVTIER